MESYSVVIIYGPTAVGKSEAALELAAALDGVIINADVGQFYTPLSIGTAKPLLPDPSIEHHMFDCCDEPADLTVVDYRRRVSALVQESIMRRKRPIIVGGSGFYISSLFFPPSEFSGIAWSDALVGCVQENDNKLWDVLHGIDPLRAAKIHRHDMYRIKRALSLFYQTGVAPSAYEPVYNPIDDSFLFVNFTRERQDLYDRIDKRVELMICQGWLQEVQSLIGTVWESFLLRKKLLGYDDILHFLKSGEDVDHERYGALIELIARKTRQYAKRQLSFGRMLEKKLRPWCQPSQMSSANLTLLGLPLYIKELASIIRYSSSNE
jgi:tRNA dimethylallyltransferase